MYKFPEKFVFGVATAAYQAEGNTKVDDRGPCYWDDYLEKSKKFDPNTASDFYHKYREDIEFCKAYGVNGIRISISWSRILPEGEGKVNPKGIDYYNKLIDTCIENGVEPFVTLHHFDTPLPLYEEGDWLQRRMIDCFVNYARICFENFGDRVTKWFTINEPWSLAAGQYVIGHFPPNIKYDLGKAAQAMHNMVLAHAKVVNLYKTMNLNGDIGIIHILEPKFPINENSANKRAALYEHTFCNRFMLDATLKGEYHPTTLQIVNEILSENNGTLSILDEDIIIMKEASSNLDFLGVNYYQSHFMEDYEGNSVINHNGTGEKDTSTYAIKGVGKRVIHPDVPTTDWDWSIYPEGLYQMLLEVYQGYGFAKPIYITENGVGVKEQLKDNTVDDTQRIDYIHGHLEAILRAIKEGVDVQGYFLWSLMDVFSWTNGYNKRYGLLYVDFETQERFIKKSAHWFKKIATKKVLSK